MKYKLILVTTLLFTFFTKAQNLNEKEIMGEWNTVSVFIPDEVPEKEAVKFMIDAFTGAKFNFKGNTVFKIKFGKTADSRIKELFFIDGENWVIENDQIKIGTDGNGFSTMHITVQKTNGKTYFLLPMMRLEMEKIKDDEPSKPKISKSKNTKQNKPDYSNIELINKEIEINEIVDFKDIENPPLAPKCKSKWDIEKRKKCTSKYINMFLARKFNTDLAGDVGLVGKVRIMIEFVIDINGKAINITASGGPEIMNQNAIDVIGILPNLKPATKDGKPINVSYKLPLSFFVAE